MSDEGIVTLVFGVLFLSGLVGCNILSDILKHREIMKHGYPPTTEEED